MNAQTLDEWEERAKLENFLHVSHSLELIAEVRRLRGMMQARAHGDSPELPCSQCGAGPDHLGLGCHTCNNFRLSPTSARTSDE